MLRSLFAGAVLALLFGGSAAAAAKPLVVILAEPEGTEVTDMLAPYAILAESGAVEVRIVSPTAQPVRMMPGVAWVKPQLTLDELARDHPAGPAVVIVPAMHHPEDPVRAAWLRAQMKRGARIMSICDGARVLADAGLLDGREAVTHWSRRKQILKAHPSVKMRDDLRWVSDGPITTTAGVTAAIPATLALVRDLAGEQVMQETAQRLQLEAPVASHAGKDFRFTSRAVMVGGGNFLRFWDHQDIAVPVGPGADELGVALALDSWSMTFRSTAWVVSSPGALTRHGLKITGADKPPSGYDRTVSPPSGRAMQIELAAIRQAYGDPTARFVGLVLEDPYGAVSAW
jgi:putative intracellular protease/amidase